MASKAKDDYGAITREEMYLGHPVIFVKKVPSQISLSSTHFFTNHAEPRRTRVVLSGNESLSEQVS